MNATQQALTGDTPHDAGLWPRYVTGGAIDHAQWLRARAESQFVGTCRRCGDYLVPDPPAELAGRTDYTARCRRAEECGYELAAPGGRVMRHSGRRSDQPGKPPKTKSTDATFPVRP